MDTTPPKPGPDSLSNNPINLLLAFLLELAGLFAMGFWGWTQHEGFVRILLGLGLPILAAVIWGVFRVDGAPGKAPVRVPGLVRLLIEWGFYAIAVICFFAAGQTAAAIVMAVLVIGHTAASIDHVRWKLAQ